MILSPTRDGVCGERNEFKKSDVVVIGDDRVLRDTLRLLGLEDMDL